MNGQLKAEQYMNNDMREGIMRRWRPTGELLSGKEKYIKVLKYFYINFSVYIKKEPCVLF